MRTESRTCMVAVAAVLSMSGMAASDHEEVAFPAGGGGPEAVEHYDRVPTLVLSTLPTVRLSFGSTSGSDMSLVTVDTPLELPKPKIYDRVPDLPVQAVWAQFVSPQASAPPQLPDRQVPAASLKQHFFQIPENLQRRPMSPRPSPDTAPNRQPPNSGDPVKWAEANRKVQLLNAQYERARQDLVEAKRKVRHMDADLNDPRRPERRAAIRQQAQDQRREELVRQGRSEAKILKELRKVDKEHARLEKAWDGRLKELGKARNQLAEKVGKLQHNAESLDRYSRDYKAWNDNGRLAKGRPKAPKLQKLR